MPQPRAWSRLVSVSTLLTTWAVALGVHSSVNPAEACEPLGFEVEVLLPRPTDAPTNAVLYAYLVAPPAEGVEVSLVDGDGATVEIELRSYESTGEVGLVRARPLAALEPGSDYAWRVHAVGYPEPIVAAFTTATAPDEQPPEVGAVAVAELGPTTIFGCFELPGLGFEVGVTELDEPAVIELRGAQGGLWGGVVPSYDGPVLVQIPSDPPPAADPCFQVFVEDAGGNRIELPGLTCLDAADDGAPGDGDGDASGESGDSGGSGDDGESGESGDSGGSGDAPGLDDGELSHSCACALDDPPAAPGFALLALAALGFARPRRGRD